MGNVPSGMNVCMRQCAPATKPAGLPLLIVQLVLVTLVLVTTAATPTRGNTATLLPLVDRSPADTFSWARQHGIPIIGAGERPGSLVVLAPDSMTAWGMLLDGMLLLAAAPPACDGRNNRMERFDGRS